MLNRIIERSVVGQPVPVVGMGASEIMFSDRHGGTIIEVSKSGKLLVWQQDTAQRVDNNGMSESQKYEFTPNPEGRKSTYTLRQNGQWILKGDPIKHGTKLRIGERLEYYDFSY